MIAEASVLILLKLTFAAGGSAWAVVVCEGDWSIAVVGLLPLLLCGVLLWDRSRRLSGGEHAEGSP